MKRCKEIQKNVGMSWMKYVVCGKPVKCTLTLLQPLLSGKGEALTRRRNPRKKVCKEEKHGVMKGIMDEKVDQQKWKVRSNELKELDLDEKGK